MDDKTEKSVMDTSPKNSQSYQSFQPIMNEKINTSPSINDEQEWSRDRIRNLISNILTLVSLVFLIPGLWYPMINVHITALGGVLVVVDETRSILSTISYLFEHNAYLVGILIILFSVVVPFLKAILLLLMNVSKNARYNYAVYSIVRDWGKWSMADVFVTAIFMSYLSATVSVDIKATLLGGFYCFLAYCIISLLAVQVMVSPSMVDVEMDHEKIEISEVNRNTTISNIARGDHQELEILEHKINNVTD